MADLTIEVPRAPVKLRVVIDTGNCGFAGNIPIPSHRDPTDKELPLIARAFLAALTPEQRAEVVWCEPELAAARERIANLDRGLAELTRKWEAQCGDLVKARRRIAELEALSPDALARLWSSELGTRIQELETERDALRAEVERVRPVVEAVGQASSRRPSDLRYYKPDADGHVNFCGFNTPAVCLAEDIEAVRAYRSIAHPETKTECLECETKEQLAEVLGARLTELERKLAEAERLSERRREGIQITEEALHAEQSRGDDLERERDEWKARAEKAEGGWEMVRDRELGERLEDLREALAQISGSPPAADYLETDRLEEIVDDLRDTAEQALNADDAAVECALSLPAELRAAEAAARDARAEVERMRPVVDAAIAVVRMWREAGYAVDMIAAECKALIVAVDALQSTDGGSDGQ